ncbi:MAG: hypothetical protein DSZ16_06610 [Candidatus Thioglobus sp.]|nr:MAG: hypothetical protein DSZ16_06610 [Candidatus Thioglobus sp.]
MIDGIDYYPREKKSNHKFKLWVLFLLLMGVFSYWYLDQKKSLEKPKSTLIVISEPEIYQAVETIPVVITPIQSKQKTPEMLENLDEVMQTYNRENP